MKEINSTTSTDVLWISFLYLKFIGAWKPLRLSKWLRVIYNLCTITMVLLMCTMMIIAQILFIVFAEENQSKVFKDNAHMTITQVSGLIKMLNIISRRRSIILLVNGCVAKQWNPPRNSYESSIHTGHNNLYRTTTLAYSGTVGVTTAIHLLNPILSSEWLLPLDAWYPCNISSPICYWTSVVHQSIGFLALAIVHVANDSLIIGFMIQLCIRLNFLSQRLLSINDKVRNLACRQKNQERIFETSLVNECISNYNDILKSAELLSETFIEVVFVQFCVGLSVICTTIYTLARMNIFTLEFIGILLYLVCMMGQMFLYCWYGNEVTLNSTKLFHSIYHMNWIQLQGPTQKSLLLMMIVTFSPVQLFKGAIIRVNLDAFIGVLKFSYSAFNILQKSL